MAIQSTAQILARTGGSVAYSVSNTAGTIDNSPQSKLLFQEAHLYAQNNSNHSLQNRFSENRIQSFLDRFMQLVDKGELSEAHKLEAQVMTDFPQLSSEKHMQLDAISPGHYDRCKVTKEVTVPAVVQSIEHATQPQQAPNPQNSFGAGPRK